MDTSHEEDGLSGAARTLVNCYAAEHISVACTPTPRGLAMEMSTYVAPGFDAFRRAQTRFQQLCPDVPVTWV